MSVTTTENTEVARCRHCGRELIGKPYHMGGEARHPITNKKCPVNYYGGFVCSYVCDRDATMALESSIPGAGRSTRLYGESGRRVASNWAED